MKMITPYRNRITNCKLFLEDEPLTGGISTTMLKDLGIEYVLVGHSEQRNFLEGKQ